MSCSNIHEGVGGVPTHIRTEKRQNLWSFWRPQLQPISRRMVSPYERKQSHHSLPRRVFRSINQGAARAW